MPAIKRRVLQAVGRAVPDVPVEQSSRSRLGTEHQPVGGESGVLQNVVVELFYLPKRLIL